jgi:hypothetical protein
MHAGVVDSTARSKSDLRSPFALFHLLAHS